MPLRLHIEVAGCVQGVGFRPTVYRHATALGLTGFVSNGTGGVVIEVEGSSAAVTEFRHRLETQPPPQARIEAVRVREVAPQQSPTFEITASERSGDLAAGMPPDLALCDDCRHELFTPGDRRHRYPFINCTNCGPRFTIIGALPYDRERTSMAPFVMCPDCAAEYADPRDRRFDAQPDACPVCGPRLTLRLPDGAVVTEDPLAETVRRLRAGEIGAVKGLGGFHLCCLATDDATVQCLRQRKHRPDKSLAVMFRDLDELRRHCRVEAAAEALLLSPARPIVALPRLPNSALSAFISPDTDDVGAFLPYTPLHALLLDAISPLVMTSANLSEEPIVSDFAELGTLLGAVADFALDHDRKILRRCDDSVVKVARGTPLLLRRSRGFVPRAIALPHGGPSVLACGAEVKNTFCITRGAQAFMSQHIGDLTDLSAYSFFRQSAADLEQLLQVRTALVAHDLHPDYLSTRFALAHPAPRKLGVQHHHAHIAGCMAENGLDGPVIGVALDGTGYGTDGTLWGGEFLIATRGSFERAACFRPYPLPGGEEAVRHPARTALSCLVTEFGAGGLARAADLLPSLPEAERMLLVQMIQKRLNSPLTSSAGRLFDAVGALLGFDAPVTYEGQAAIRLQTLALRSPQLPPAYEFRIEPGPPARLSFAPALEQVMEALRRGQDRAEIAAAFHVTVAVATAAMCTRLRNEHGLSEVVLSGGVFQNDLLLTLLLERLEAARFCVFTHRDVPPNDGCIALGQAVVALETLAG